MKKLFKNPVICSIAVGLLTSALWQAFFSPLFASIYVFISSLIDKFITTFSDSTYREISNGFNDSYAVYILIFILYAYFLVAFIPYSFHIAEKIKSISLFSSLQNKDESQKVIEKRHKLLNLLIAFSMLSSFLVSVYLIGNLIYITNCKTKSLTNMEIISPYISDLEYKQLKSSFYLIQNKDDYDAFTSTLDELGKKYSLNLKQQKFFIHYN